MDVNKPEPIVISGKKIELFNRSTDIEHTIKALELGKPVLIIAFYSNGLLLLKELKLHLKRKLPNKECVIVTQWQLHQLQLLVTLQDALRALNPTSELSLCTQH